MRWKPVRNATILLGCGIFAGSVTPQTLMAQATDPGTCVGPGCLPGPSTETCTGADCAAVLPQAEEPAPAAIPPPTWPETVGNGTCVGPGCLSSAGPPTTASGAETASASAFDIPRIIDPTKGIVEPGTSV